MNAYDIKAKELTNIVRRYDPLLEVRVARVFKPYRTPEGKTLVVPRWSLSLYRNIDEYKKHPISTNISLFISGHFLMKQLSLSDMQKNEKKYAYMRDINYFRKRELDRVRAHEEEEIAKEFTALANQRKYFTN